jgi:hypothetical protein
MKRLNRLRLEQLEEQLLPLESGILSSLIGGGNGSYENPYTVSEMDSLLDNGNWNGGYVVGMGYVLPASTTYGYGGGYGNYGYDWYRDALGYSSNIANLPFASALDDFLHTKGFGISYSGISILNDAVSYTEVVSALTGEVGIAIGVIGYGYEKAFDYIQNAWFEAEQYLRNLPYYYASWYY